MSRARRNKTVVTVVCNPCFKNKSEGFKISEHTTSLETAPLEITGFDSRNVDEESILGWDFTSYGDEYIRATGADKPRRFAAVKNNAEFALQEAATRMAPEEYAEVQGAYDPVARDIIMDDRSLRQQSKKGLGRSKIAEINERSAAEDAEVETVLSVLADGTYKNHELFFLSRCGETEDADFVHEIKKGMVRRWRFEESEGKVYVFTQSVSFDGRLLDDYKTADFLKEAGADYTLPTATPLQALQTAITRKAGGSESLLEVLSILDACIGPDVALGQKTLTAWRTEDYRDYFDSFSEYRKKISRLRNKVAGEIIKLSQLEMSLGKKEKAFQLNLATHIHTISKEQPQIGVRAYGKEIGEDYVALQALIKQGKTIEATTLDSSLFKTAIERTAVCGMECGVRPASSKELAILSGLGIEVSGNKTAVSFEGSACKKCPEKGYVSVIDNETGEVDNYCRNPNCPTNSDKSLALAA